jgi:signal transduction histidine kinase/CheY-like chemotaxis protein
MVEQMQKGAATLSDEGVVLYCNPFLATLMDLPIASVVGCPLASLQDERAGDTLGPLLQAASVGISRGEVAFRKNLGTVPTQVSITRLPVEGAHVFCIIVTDLTERKRMEAERAQHQLEQLARAAAEQAHAVAQVEIARRTRVEESLRQAEIERTLLLERERIARTEAEAANRLKDEFLATLSHELRSPLNAIVAWSHILRDPGLDPVTVSRAVEAIDRNARAQAQLVADILDVSRIVTGKFHLQMAPVALAAVIESAADTVRPAARARAIRLEVSIDPRADLVSGDAGRLQQVIWNLLSNAIKFTASGGRVQVRLENAGSNVELTVTDDGPGIDPGFLPHVFERFRQADSSSTRSHGGLGLGLAIVRHLVELHGGTVAAHNRPDGPGAVFRVRLPPLPALSAENAAAAGPPFLRATGSPLSPSLQGVSVVIVDDDDDSREAMALGLGRHGAQVTTARSAAEAFEVITRERPSVLVADIGMAGEDGYALLHRLRAQPAERGGATPAIALTGYANQQDRVNALWAGFEMHLSKPVTATDLAAAVADLLAPELEARSQR